MNLNNKLFKGRYGMSKLSMVFIVLGFISIVYSILIGLSWRYSPGLLTGVILIAYGFWRCMSKKIYKRQAEDRAFDIIIYKIKGMWYRVKVRLGIVNRPKRDKNYKIIKCPICNQKMRVPKGKGLIRITCKKCTKKFERRV